MGFGSRGSIPARPLAPWKTIRPAASCSILPLIVANGRFMTYVVWCEHGGFVREGAPQD